MSALGKYYAEWSALDHRICGGRHPALSQAALTATIAADEPCDAPRGAAPNEEVQ